MCNLYGRSGSHGSLHPLKAAYLHTAYLSVHFLGKQKSYTVTEAGGYITTLVEVQARTLNALYLSIIASFEIKAFLI
jgi:hypothetical protein